jgi:hypothetical protein
MRNFLFAHRMPEGTAATSECATASAPVMQRELQALALPPPVQPQPAQPPPELLVRRSTRSEAEDLWQSIMTGSDPPALVESPVPLHSLPYTWKRLAIQRGDGSIYELADTFVRLPSNSSPKGYFYPLLQHPGLVPRKARFLGSAIGGGAAARTWLCCYTVAAYV